MPSISVSGAPSRVPASIASERPSAENGLVSVPLRNRSGAIADAVRRLDEAGITIDDIALRRPTLDDVFLRLTGQAIEHDEELQEAERR